jgi:hypothetical protein
LKDPLTPVVSGFFSLTEAALSLPESDWSAWRN